jgi:RHS repeat-associated protein
VNPGSNQLDGSGDTYDANGNAATSPSGQTLGYDAENRLIQASVNASSYVQYAYDSQNKRIFASPYASSAQNAPVIYFYGVDGQQLGAFAGGTCWLETSFYLGSKRVGYTGSESCGAYYTDPVPFGAPTEADRLGSNGTYYPWGEAKGSTNPADIWSFGTYWRDSFTGLDYANQRYYSNVQGRFMTPDPYRSNAGGAGDPADPGSWNRYTYTRGDPVNRADPAGTSDCPGDSCGDPIGWGGDNPGSCDPSDPSISNCPGDGQGPGVSGSGGGTPPITTAEADWFETLEQQGLVNGMAVTPTGIDFSFVPGGATIAAAACAADPVCVVAAVAVGGALTIYVAYRYWPAFAQAVENVYQMSRPTSRSYAPVYLPYDTGRNANGRCNPGGPLVKWPGSDASHWHYIVWNVNPQTCLATPTFETGPDPGPNYINIGRMPPGGWTGLPPQQ